MASLSSKGYGIYKHFNFVHSPQAITPAVFILSKSKEVLFESDKFKDYLHLFFLEKTKMGIEPAVITPWLLQDLNYINFSDTMSAVNCNVSMPV